jgi:glycosyltransferase involved in cell wall biosynthesis
VLYEPAAAVVSHGEGGSVGTETGPGFAEKWRDVLRDQPEGPSPEGAYAAANHRAGPVVLVVDHRVPTPDRDSGSLRMRHLLEGLQRLGRHVVFVADDLIVAEPYTSRLRATGVEVVVGDVSLHQRLEQLGAGIELAILCRPYVAPRYLHLVRDMAPGARLVYDTVDLHFVREGRRAETLGNGASGVARSFRELELGIARASDTTLVVSEVEREELLRLEPGLDVRVVPNAHHLRGDDPPGRGGREGLLFVGGFEHAPNADAVLYLVQEVMPLVWSELGDVRLSIVGANAPEQIRALAGPNVEVAGWVEELESRIDLALANVAPLRYGAGLKGKVTQSLAAGLPVVTTTVGAEGTGALDGRHLFVADDPELFARRVIELHRDPEVWSTLSVEGRLLAGRVASADRQVEVLGDLLEPALT